MAYTNQKTLSLLLILAAPLSMLSAVGALAQKASPKEMECHAEATQRYIDDFRQLGQRHNETDETVIVFVNEKSRYEVYYAECLGRWNSMKVR